MSWENEVKEIKKRLKLIQEMGGKEKIKRQYDAGRTTVRERIFALVDKGSFKEIGRLTGLSEYNEDGTLKSLMAVNSVIGHAKRTRFGGTCIFPGVCRWPLRQKTRKKAQQSGLSRRRYLLHLARKRPQMCPRKNPPTRIMTMVSRY